MQVDGTRMYRVKDVAEFFNVSASTIYRAIESGQLEVLRLGTAVRVPGTVVLTYAKTCWQTTDLAVSTTSSAPGELTPRQAEIEAFQRRTEDADSPAEVAR